MECSHSGPCAAELSPAICARRQQAESVKYSVNLTWQFAEIEPDFFALYNPIHREVAALGTIEECLAVYRARAPYVARPYIPSRAPRRIDTSKLEFNI